MAYDNVDTAQLKQALNNCLNTLSSSNLEEVDAALLDSIWKGKAKDNLKTAIQTLKNERYQTLKDKINSYISEVDKIEQYQSTSSSIDSLKSQKVSKTNELNKEKAKSPQNKTKINQLQNDIDSLNSQISSKQSEQNSISISL